MNPAFVDLNRTVPDDLAPALDSSETPPLEKSFDELYPVFILTGPSVAASEILPPISWLCKLDIFIEPDAPLSALPVFRYRLPVCMFNTAPVVTPTLPEDIVGEDGVCILSLPVIELSDVPDNISTAPPMLEPTTVVPAFKFTEPPVSLLPASSAILPPLPLFEDPAPMLTSPDEVSESLDPIAIDPDGSTLDLDSVTMLPDELSPLASPVRILILPVFKLELPDAIDIFPP